MMRIDFWKMHGLGNDFIVLDDRDKTIAAYIDYPDLAVRLCHRNFGIGADGIILVRNSQIHDIGFVIINSDGSEPEMCGNGIRCFAKYLYENKILVKDEIKVQTLAGMMIPRIEKDSSGKVTGVCVDMGVPTLVPEQIPFVHDIRDTFFALIRWHVVIQQCQLDILGNSQFIDQIEALKNEADISLANIATLRLGVLRNILIEEKVVAVAWIIKQADNVKQCRFSAT